MKKIKYVYLFNESLKTNPALLFSMSDIHKKTTVFKEL